MPVTAPSTPYRRGALALLPSAVIGLCLLVFGAYCAGEVWQATTQVELANRRLSSLQTLQTATATYSRRSHQVIFEGYSPQSDLREARLAMERALVRLAQDARTQAEATKSSSNTRELLTELENARRMLELYHAIDAAAGRAFVLARDGKHDEALEVLARDVDFRLASEFSAVLSAAFAAKQQEASGLGVELAALLKRTQLGLAALVLALFFALGLAFCLHRRELRYVVAALPAEIERRSQELREANERLRENDARRSQFLADVSHELRTPLTILRGEADVALLPSSPVLDQRRSLERIQSQAAEMAQLLDDLLAFARTNAEGLELQTSQLRVEDVITTAVEEAEILAEPREITLRLHLLQTSLWVEADLRRLKQAIIVGLDNAINHSPPGSEIHIEASRIEDKVRITIVDTGPGLTIEDEQRAFDRFYRGDQSANASGLGIGLAIARSIVEAHQGTVTLTNTAEGGGVLTIELRRLGGAHH